MARLSAIWPAKRSQPGGSQILRIILDSTDMIMALSEAALLENMKYRGKIPCCSIYCGVCPNFTREKTSAQARKDVAEYINAAWKERGFIFALNARLFFVADLGNSLKHG
jgi:hypothetical protein